MSGTSTLPAENLTFEKFVTTGLKSWDVLKHAVDAGFGGEYSREKAEFLIEEVIRYFRENSQLESDEVETFVCEILNNEFDLVLDGDVGLQILCRSFCFAFDFFDAHSEPHHPVPQRIVDEYASYLDKCQKLAENRQRPIIENDDCSESDDDDDVNEIEQCSTSQDARDLTSDMQNVTLDRKEEDRRQEPDADGWTTSCDTLWQQAKEYQNQFVGKLSEIQRLRQFLNQNRQPINGAVKSDQQQIEKCQKFVEETSKHAGQIYQRLVETRKNILLLIKQCSDQVSIIRNDLVNKVLLEWKRHQKLAQIGLPFEKGDEFLNKISIQFENLTEELWQLRTYSLWMKEHLEQAPNLPDNNVQLCLSVLTPIINSLTKELEELVSSSFIVSKQPPVVLKQHNKFASEIRLLIGDKLGIRFLNLKVNVKLISEENARGLKDGAVEICNVNSVAKIGMSDSNSGQQDVHVEVSRDGRSVTASFKSRLLKVDPRKSSGKTSDDQGLVCERNYALLFTCSAFTVGDINFPSLWTLSLPVKITVHGSQERLSQAMILWDHAFAPAESPFNVPESVEWGQLADALQSKFKVHTGTTKPLSKSDLDYLREKLSSGNGNQISLGRFCKEPMREDVDFSFWAWFFEIMVLIKQKLQKCWDDGLVKGFIGRQAAADLVLSQPQPSFLLRFSDTLLGGLSISFLASLDDGSLEVLPLAPFTIKDLDHLSLPQRIVGCPSLQHIDYICGADGNYDRNLLLKDIDAGKRKELSKDAHSYVVPELIMVVPSKSGSDLNMMSPNMYNSSSPDQSNFMNQFDSSLFSPLMTSPLDSTQDASTSSEQLQIDLMRIMNSSGSEIDANFLRFFTDDHDHMET